VEKLAEKIDAGIKEKYDELAPAKQDPEAFINSLAKLVPKGDKPILYISVPESHLTRQIPDPAVETELKKTLIELGYTVVAGSEKSKADLFIHGEAFSEFAVRFGRLVSCRARLELEITNPKTGQILLAERTTVAKADIAENVAAKGALQKAATELLPAVVPVLKM
jgi:hypothetical protein